MVERKARGAVGIAAIVALGAIGILVPAGSATAATPDQPSLLSPAQVRLFVADADSVLPANVGIDFSYPQCSDGSPDQHLAYPSGIPFAVIGVNKGVTTNYNPCFAAEYSDALNLSNTAAEPVDSVYVNTGDPALAASWWPSSNETKGDVANGVDPLAVVNPKGTCAHKAGSACAYVYGYSAAQLDLASVKENGFAASVPSTWWLDVETTNTWQTDKAANASALLGMKDYLRGQGLTVGLYSTAYQWSKIAGTTSSTSGLAGLPSWLAGGSASGAAKSCTSSALTPGGAVWMVQYINGDFDNDYACQLFPLPAASISPAGSSLVGTKLTAVPGDWTGAGTPTVSYTYQWYRNGAAIANATKSVHTTTSSDRGRTLTVRIRARATGFRTTYVTSDGVSILGKITPGKVSISGTQTQGKTLTAAHGTWSPSTVTFTYAWYRGDEVVGTSKTCQLTSDDAGQTITLTITGSRTGYQPATKTVTTKTIKAAS